MATASQYAEIALDAYTQASSPEYGTFQDNRDVLIDAVRLLVKKLKEDNHYFEAALAEEAEITLRLIFSRDELKTSGIHDDLVQIKRRLPE